MKQSDILFRKPKVSKNIIKIIRNEKVLLINSEKPNWIVVSHPLAEIILSCDGNKSIEAIINELNAKYNKDFSKKLISCFEKIYNLKFFEDDNVKIIEQSKTLDTIYFNLTKRCNLKCIYCYAEAEDKCIEDLPFEFWQSVVNQIVEINKNATIVFTGGEPTLYTYFWDIVEYVKTKKLKATLITNGTTVRWNEIKKYIDYFENIEVSIDSLREEINCLTRGINSLNKAKKFIDILIEKGRMPIIMVVVTKLNKDFLYEFIDEYKSSAKVRFQILYRMGRAKTLENISITGDEYYNILKSQGIDRMKDDISYKRNTKYIWCGMGRNVLSIEYNGIVYPCHLMHIDEFKMGDLKIQSLKSIWEKSVYRSFSVDMIEGCKDCELRYICSAPCRARAFYVCGDIFKKDPICSDFIKKSIYDNLFKS